MRPSLHCILNSLPDQTELTTAQTFLEQAAQTNLVSSECRRRQNPFILSGWFSISIDLKSSLFAPQAELLKTLSDILVHGGNSAVARRQAGLQLKNRLMSNDDTVRHAVQERWLQVREDAGNVRFPSTGPPNFLPDTMYRVFE